jgi:hypothetical protein
MYPRTHRLFRTLLVASAVLAVGPGAARAATLASGPLRIGDLQNYSCSAVNAGTRDVTVEVIVTIEDGGFGTSEACSPLSPTSVCSADNEAAFAKYRYCTIKTTSKRDTRGTFCNTTTGVCIPVQ